MHALIKSLNRIFGHDETRGLIALWIQSVLYLFFLSIIIFTLFLYLFGERVFHFIFETLNLSNYLLLFIAIFSCLYLHRHDIYFYVYLYVCAQKSPDGF